MNSSDEGSHHSNSDFDFKDCHFDLSGAKSLVIADNSIASNSTAKAVSKSTGSVGAAVRPFGDDSSVGTNADYSLYKTDEYGNYIKVLLYGNDVQSGENGETEEGAQPIEFDMVPVTMEISDDGKFVLIAYANSRSLITNPQTDETSAWVVYVVISTDTGKVYKITENGTSIMLNSKAYSGYFYDYYGLPGTYKIIGSYDSNLLLRYFQWQNATYYSAHIDGGELVLKEILSSKIIDGLQQQCHVYNYGIVKTSTNTEAYLTTPDGGLAMYKNTYKVYGNTLCTSVDYYDPTNFFVSSYTVIKGIDKNTGDIITEKIDLTKEQSYQLALKNRFASEIYKKTVNDGTMVYVMEACNTLFKFKLNTDCTVTNYGTVEGRITLPFSLGKAGQNNITDETTEDWRNPLTKEGNYLDGYTYSYPSSVWTPSLDYRLFQGHICQCYPQTNPVLEYEVPMGMALGDIVISDGVLYKLSNGLVTSYNIDTGATASYPIAKVVKVQSMDIINDTVVIKAITANGSLMTGSLDLTTGNFDTNYSKVLSEVRLKALN